MFYIINNLVLYNFIMADATPNGDPKANAEGQQPDDNTKGKQDPTADNKGKQSGNANNAELEGLKTKNEFLKKTVDALNVKIDNLTKGIKTAFGGSEGEEADAKDPLKLIEGLNAKIGSLEAENKKVKATNILHNVVDNLVDGENKPFSDEIKKFLKSDISVDEPDEDKIKETVSKKANSLAEIFKGRGVTYTADVRPENKASVGGSNLSAKSANEVLKSLQRN